MYAHTFSTSTNRLVQWTVKDGIKIHLWGCFSKQGFVTLHLFTYNLIAKKMLQIYCSGMFSREPCVERYFITRLDSRMNQWTDWFPNINDTFFLHSRETTSELFWRYRLRGESSPRQTHTEHTSRLLRNYAYINWTLVQLIKVQFDQWNFSW